MKQQTGTAKLSPSSLEDIFFAVVMLSSRAAIPTYTTLRLTGRAGGSVPERRMQAHSSSRSGATYTPPPTPPLLSTLQTKSLGWKSMHNRLGAHLSTVCKAGYWGSDEKNLSGEE